MGGIEYFYQLLIGLEKEATSPRRNMRTFKKPKLDSDEKAQSTEMVPLIPQPQRGEKRSARARHKTCLPLPAKQTVTHLCYHEVY